MTDGLHVTAGELHEHREARGALDQRRELRPLPAQEQVTLPVAGHCTILHLGRSLANGDRALDLRAPLPRGGVVHAASQGAPRTQMGAELPRQHAAGLDVQGPVDRLVRHAHCAPRGMVLLEGARDLFG